MILWTMYSEYRIYNSHKEFNKKNVFIQTYAENVFQITTMTLFNILFNFQNFSWI